MNFNSKKNKSFGSESFLFLLGIVLNVGFSCHTFADEASGKPALIHVQFLENVSIPKPSDVFVPYIILKGSHGVSCQIFNSDRDSNLTINRGEIIDMREVYWPSEPSWTSDERKVSITCMSEKIPIQLGDYKFHPSLMTHIKSGMAQSLKITEP